MISKEDWDALNHAVAVAQAALLLNNDSAAQPELIIRAREVVNHMLIKRPGSFLPSRHPNAKN